MNITFIGSPNFSRGRGANIDMIVLHWAVGTLAGTDSVFQDTVRETSAHYMVEDNEVHQYVREQDKAWHSGIDVMNNRSIGIEHSAAPGRPASEETLNTSAELIATLCQRYDIPCDRAHIIGHSEVPYATQCPGSLPIDTIIRKAKDIIEGENMPASQQKIDEMTVRLGYNIGMFRQPKADEIKHWLNTGMNVEQFLRAVLVSKEHEDIGKSASITASDFEKLDEPVYVKKGK